MIRSVLLRAICALPLLVNRVVAQTPASPTYTERYRPQFHFTPAVNWTNDPNGLVYYDGEYHLFYQHNPFGIKWGHMSWGHAVSTDLVHWQHLPVAIPEEKGVMAFSGSAVVDWKNTSGFGKNGNPPLIAIYTGHTPTNQSQYIAYSTDRGRTWTRYAKNPVLDVGKKDFRDPKVFWYEPGKKWIMALAIPDEHKIRFYGSSDLKAWAQLSEFGPAGATGGVWECPDLFELPVVNDAGKKRWVLIVNLNPGGIQGGSATQYFVGSFDGTRFTSDAPASASALWADWGKDFYAAVTFNDMPIRDGRRMFIGWMSNWQYGQDIPTTPWRSAMTVPRVLTLQTTKAGVRLASQPIAEIERLRGAKTTLAPMSIPVGSTSIASRGVRGAAIELIADIDMGTASEVGLEVRTGANEKTVIGVDAKTGRLFIDRTHSGDVAFHKDFAGRHSAPLAIRNGSVNLRVLVDWSSVEVFANGGETVMTDQIFPSPESQGVALYAKGGAAKLVGLGAWPLASAWTTGASAAKAAKAGK